MAYFIHQNGENDGPYTIGQLRSMWASGLVTGDTLYCEVGYEDWFHLRVLSDELEPPHPQPPPLQPLPSPPLLAPARKSGEGRWLLVGGLIIAGGLALLVLVGLVLPNSRVESVLSSPSDRSAPAPAAIEPKPSSPANLMAHAEAALRGSKFGQAADLFNTIATDYPDSQQAATTRTLISFLRDGEAIKTASWTSSEAQRLRSLMDAFDKITRGYHTTTPEKKRALEDIFGADMFRDGNRGGLESLSSSSSRLRNARDRAIEGR